MIVVRLLQGNEGLWTSFLRIPGALCVLQNSERIKMIY